MILRKKPVKGQFNVATSDPLMQNTFDYKNYTLQNNSPFINNTYDYLLRTNGNTAFTGTGAQIKNELANTDVVNTPYTGAPISKPENKLFNDGQPTNLGNMAAQVGASTIAAADQFAEDRMMKKNFSKKDSFGNTIISEEDAKKTGNKLIAKDIASSTAQGALTGMTMGGPIGAAIGAGAGLIKGVFTGVKKKKDLQEDADEYAKQFGINMAGYNRNSDIARAKALMGKKGLQLGKFSVKTDNSNFLVMKNGGKLEEVGAVNVVAKGKMHRENNELGNKDKGIPIINKDGVKEYEIEAGEVVFRQEATDRIEEFVEQYDKTQDDAVLEDMGKYLADELLTNTVDNYGKFKVKPKHESKDSK